MEVFEYFGFFNLLIFFIERRLKRLKVFLFFLSVEDLVSDFDDV